MVYGGHQRSGLAATAKLIRRLGDGAKLAIRLEYSKFELVTNENKHEEEKVTKLEVRILVHCLLLPYVLPNKTFKKQFAVVYDD